MSYFYSDSYASSNPKSMSRGRGYSSYRGRGGNGGGNDSWNSDGRSSYSSRGGRYNWKESNYDSRSSSSRYSGRGRGSSDDYRRYSRDASTSRRSYEGNSSYGSDYSSRYNSYLEAERSYRDEPRSYRDRSREEYKKSEQMLMPPPSSMPVRRRGSYRSRIRGSRGMPRYLMNKRSEPLSYKRRGYSEYKSMTIARRSEVLKRLRLQKLRRIARLRRDADEKKKDINGLSDKEDKGSESESTPKKKKVKKMVKKIVKKIVKKKKTIPKSENEEPEEGEEVDEGEEVEEEEEEEEEVETEVEEEVEEDEKPDDSKESKKKDSDKERRSRSKSYIKLSCPHCHIRCITFLEYKYHLQSKTHLTSMRNHAFYLKRTLAKMRMSQRQKQLEIEADEAIKETLSGTVNFCSVCRLQYKIPRVKHNASDSHVAMKKFLKPYCRICNIDFSTPMLYENHLCSIGHIKRKAVHDEKKSEENCDERDVDINKFMVLDSVEDDDTAEGNDEQNSEKKKLVNVGAEFVKKCEAQFCDLCRTYLPHQEEPERALVIHCRTRLHLSRLIRHHKDKVQRKEEERAKRRKAEKEGQEKKKSSISEAMEVDDEKADKKTGDEGDLDDQDGIDEKLWADVDKDLGDLLREVGPGNKSSDEDEDSRAGGGRYDRFRNSEKGSNELSEGEQPNKSTSEEKMETDNSDKKDGRVENEETGKNAKSSNTTD